MRWDIFAKKVVLNVGIAVLISSMPALDALSRGVSVNWRMVEAMALGSGALALTKLVMNLLKHLGAETPT